MYLGGSSYLPAEGDWSGGLALRYRREAQESRLHHEPPEVIAECVASSLEKVQESLARLELVLDSKHHLLDGRTNRSISACDPRYEWFR